MKIGFSGTQSGMTDAQKHEFFCLAARLKTTEFHHGDCTGADEDAHNLIVTIFKSLKEAEKIIGKISIHPPVNESKRAFCRALDIRPARPYLERNHDIVNETDVLIATPKEFEEQLRSGTWATIRYARKQKREIFIIYPDGKIQNENQKRRN